MLARPRPPVPDAPSSAGGWTAPHAGTPRRALTDAHAQRTAGAGAGAAGQRGGGAGPGGRRALNASRNACRSASFQKDGARLGPGSAPSRGALAAACRPGPAGSPPAPHRARRNSATSGAVSAPLAVKLRGADLRRARGARAQRARSAPPGAAAPVHGSHVPDDQTGQTCMYTSREGASAAQHAGPCAGRRGRTSRPGASTSGGGPPLAAGGSRAPAACACAGGSGTPAPAPGSACACAGAG